MCPSNVSQTSTNGSTALALAIEGDNYFHREGCGECAAVLRAAGAEEPESDSEEEEEEEEDDDEDEEAGE